MNTHETTCPVCGEGYLRERVVQETTEYKGRTGETPLHFSECDACGSEQANAAQTRANKRAMIAFRKQVDGLLTGAEVRAVRECLGINQAEAARIFGGGPVAFSKYENDDVMQSEAMDKLLRLAVDVPEAFLRLKLKAEVAAGFAAEWRTVAMESPKAKRPQLRVISSSPQESEVVWRKAG